MKLLFSPRSFKIIVKNFSFEKKLWKTFWKIDLRGHFFLPPGTFFPGPFFPRTFFPWDIFPGTFFPRTIKTRVQPDPGLSCHYSASAEVCQNSSQKLYNSGSNLLIRESINSTYWPHASFSLQYIAPIVLFSLTFIDATFVLLCQTCSLSRGLASCSSDVIPSRSVKDFYVYDRWF